MLLLTFTKQLLLGANRLVIRGVYATMYLLSLLLITAPSTRQLRISYVVNRFALN
jgi:hypothetical protein